MRTFTLLLVLTTGAWLQDGLRLAPQTAEAQTADPIPLDSTVAAANLQKKTAPVYPPLALAARVQGSVELQSTIDKEGRVADLRVIKGHSLLNDAALQAVRQWQYKPYEVKGEPKPVSTTVTLDFFLDVPPRIPPGSAVISGRIIRADGMPAAGVRVDVALPGMTSLLTFTENSGRYQLRATASPELRAGFLTDISGRYQIDGIGPGTYNIAALAGSVTVFYPGTSRDKAVSLKIESNETIVVGIDFTVP